MIANKGNPKGFDLAMLVGPHAINKDFGSPAGHNCKLPIIICAGLERIKGGDTPLSLVNAIFLFWK